MTLKITFQNFGPIISGSLDLRPFTILVGPNQSGKSFAAMAVHAFSRAYQPRPRRGYYFTSPYYPFGSDVDLDEGCLGSIHQSIVSSNTNNLVTLTREQVDCLDQLTPLGRRRAALTSSIREVFASDPEELRRHNSKTASLRLRQGSFETKFNLRTGVTTTSSDLESQGPLRIGYVDRRRKDYKKYTNGFTIEFPPSRRDSHENAYSFFQEVANALRRRTRTTQPGLIPGSLYLPAIRSGLLLSHRLFLSLLVQNVQRIGLEPISVPQMTGVTADFLQSLLDLDGQSDSSSDMSALLRRFESELTGGRIYTARTQKDVMPAYRFKSGSGFDLPLNLVSSTVTEVAPIFLFLRQRIRPNTWLIIEEPESHLSPENQAVMARFLASLLETNIRVIITTHSPFLLEQINNLILRHSSRSRRNQKQAEPTLDPQLVAAHYFDFDRSLAGSRLKKLTVDAVDGIDLEPFTSVYESLYEEAHALRQDRERG